MTLIYISGPYTGPKHKPNDYLAIERNIAKAREAAAELALCGYPFFCPHTHSAHFEAITPQVPPEFWYELDMLFLRQSTHVLLLEGWEVSYVVGADGVQREIEVANQLGIPVFDSFDELIGRLMREPVTAGDGA